MTTLLTVEIPAGQSEITVDLHTNCIRNPLCFRIKKLIIWNEGGEALITIQAKQGGGCLHHCGKVLDNDEYLFSVFASDVDGWISSCDCSEECCLEGSAMSLKLCLLKDGVAYAPTKKTYLELDFTPKCSCRD